ncbi:MAG: hypothetical protein FVQ79_13555 [Planctomycetes bacterium]|nr:hypothetical protein [Planctomycetota bacterium]
MSVKFFLSSLFFCLVLMLSGCGVTPVIDEPRTIVIGKSSIAEAGAALDEYRLRMVPIWASGQLFYKEFVGGKRKEHLKFNPANLRFIPDRRMYFGANLVIGGEAIRLGSNDEEFWLRMRPKEVDRYWSGNWKQLENCREQLLLSPKVMLEALGVISVDSSWRIVNQPGIDVLVKYDGVGLPLKKIYVRTSDYLIDKIEYYGKGILVAVEVKLSGYKKIADNVSVPGNIMITSFDEGAVQSTMEVRFKRIKRFEPSAKQLRVLFKPADSKGIENVYRLNENCQFMLE